MEPFTSNHHYILMAVKLESELKLKRPALSWRVEYIPQGANINAPSERNYKVSIQRDNKDDLIFLYRAIHEVEFDQMIRDISHYFDGVSARETS